MKKQNFMKKITFMAIAAIGFAVTANAQSTSQNATVEVNATIVQPIAISNDRDMVFSYIAVSTGGSVTMNLAGAVVASGGVSIPATSAPTSAEFTVTGTPTYAYHYLIPADFNLTNTTGTGGETIAVSDITSTYGNGVLGAATSIGSALDGSGEDVLNFGAKITLASGQVPGIYKNTTAFNVIVAYD